MLELRKITQAIGRAVMGSVWLVPENGERADLQIETDTLNIKLGAMLSSLGMSNRKPQTTPL
ncbi:MAG: hypothetical protein ACOH2N_07410 [Devosia sp.]